MIQITWKRNKEKKGCLDLYIDKVFWGTLSSYLFEKVLRLPLNFSSVQAWEEYFFALEYKKAKQIVIGWLAKQNLLTSTIQKKLEIYGISQKTCRHVLDDVKKKGLVNDEEWMERFIQMQRRKGKGPLMIRQQLKDKKVEDSVMQKMSSYLYDYDLEKEDIIELLKTKYRKRDKVEKKDREKIIRTLSRRGYRIESILDVL